MSDRRSSCGAAKRAIVLGIDGLMLPMVEHLIVQGRLPHLGRVFREGAVAKVLPFISSWGPINFMSLATGTSPGTTWQGSDMPRGVGAERGAYVAETLWEAVERSGRTSVVLSYPGAWPAVLPRGVVGVPDTGGTSSAPLTLARPARLMTSGLADRYRQPPGTRAGWIPLAARARPEPAPLLLEPPGPPLNWANLPIPGALATMLPIRGRAGGTLAELGLLLVPGGEGSWRALVCSDRDGGRVLAETEVGSWSDWMALGTTGTVDGAVRFKLLEVDDEGREVAICHSEVYPQTGFARPASVEAGLVEAVGPYASGSSAGLRPSDPFWGTAVEEAVYEGEWLAGAARHLAETREWTLFMTVYRPPDAANHGCLAFLDPDIPDYGGRDTELAAEIIAAAYGAADRTLGALLDLAGDDTVIALVADHGAAVNHVTCDVYNLLMEHGLLTLHEGTTEVDWSRTQAYIRPTRSGSEVFVNLAGRESAGVVDPADYERVQERVIDLLLDWRDPQTGRRAVALALKKRDAPLIGYWGEAAGDVQFIYNAGFVWGELPPGRSIARTRIPSVNHGPQIPTTEKGLATNMGMLALWGSGVRRGYRRPDETVGPARMSDPAPTIAHLLGIDPPAQNEGAVLGDMLA